MRIDNWPLDRIMRLPDWCFGRRWWVGDSIGHGTGGIVFALGQEQLPDKFVVWGLLISARAANCLESLSLTIRLGDHLPVNIADVAAMELVLKGMSIRAINYELLVGQNGVSWINCERLIIESAGRKLVYAANGDGAIEYELSIAFLISSMPKEVPDWLISGQATNLL